jgi:hypothetical protein
MRYFQNYIRNCILYVERVERRGDKELALRSEMRYTVARTAGLEPTTYGLEDRCSIH